MRESDPRGIAAIVMDSLTPDQLAEVVNMPEKIDRILEILPPELRVMAEGARMTLDDDQKKLVETDLVILFEALQNGDRDAALPILEKWHVPAMCYEMLGMVLTINEPLHKQPFHEIK